MITPRNVAEHKLLSRRIIIQRNYITECWEYNGARSKSGKGYGMVWIDGRFTGAHILAATLYFPYFYPYLNVLHKCDNMPCFNPEHLFQGTQAENMQDKVAKGRHHQKMKTHCPQGHEYTPENTHINPRDNGRQCLKCRKIRNDIRNKK